MIYRKRMTEVEAVIWNGNNLDEIKHLLKRQCMMNDKEDSLYKEGYTLLACIVPEGNICWQGVYIPEGNYVFLDENNNTVSLSPEEFKKQFIVDEPAKIKEIKKPCIKGISH